MHPPRRHRATRSLGCAAVVVVLCAAGLVLVQAGHAGFGWACLLVALAVVFAMNN